MTPVLLLGSLFFLQDEKFLQEPPEIHVEAKADVWFASFHGSGRLNKWFGREVDREKDAPRLSFDREGQLGDTEPAPGFDLRVVWEGEKHQYKGVRVRYRHAAWSNSGTIDRTFVVDGTTVPAGSPFHSRLQKDYGTAQFMGGIHLFDGLLDVGAWAGCHFHRESFKMATAPGEMKDAAGGLNATLGIQVEVHPVPFLFASAELCYTGGFGVPESEAVISGGFIWRHVRLEAGYRHLWEWWNLDPSIRLSIGGAFVGASVRF